MDLPKIKNREVSSRGVKACLIRIRLVCQNPQLSNFKHGKVCFRYSWAQDIKLSANFCFPLKLSVIFGFCLDGLQSLASCWNYRPQKRLPAETVPVILLPAKTLGRKQNQADNLIRKLFIMQSSLSRKQKITGSLGGSQIWGTVSTGSQNWQTSLYGWPHFIENAVLQKWSYAPALILTQMRVV